MAIVGYGKIVRILDEHTIVFNLGSETLAGSPEIGDTVAVIEYGDEVTDPETGRSLGPIEWVKARLRVKDVQAKLSIAETGRTTVSRSSMLVAQIALAESVTEQAKLNVDPASLQPAERSESKVRVGNTVRVEREPRPTGGITLRGLD